MLTVLMSCCAAFSNGGWRIKCGSTNDDRLKPLLYDNSAAPCGGQPKISDHEAVFNFSIQTDGGSQVPSAYAWSPARADGEGGGVAADAVLIDGTGHASTATGRVYTTGVFLVKCTLTINGSTQVPVQLTVATFGGPLAFTKHESLYFTIPPSAGPPPSPGVGQTEVLARSQFRGTAAVLTKVESRIMQTILAGLLTRNAICTNSSRRTFLLNQKVSNRVTACTFGQDPDS